MITMKPMKKKKYIAKLFESWFIGQYILGVTGCLLAAPHYQNSLR
ncbi:hypothetical protein theurythT_15590 [Thalassotalea eurytherma]|uniref:Uncharacterized protein n=1 Tax=Thalassotalea eurytherma TaxID=1144278 RepID=A0ABQ6H1W8_9GAMM|nr:hypothetical protein theurythT_15590 [Thalassotalea eurytherma]